MDPMAYVAVCASCLLNIALVYGLYRGAKWVVQWLGDRGAWS